MTWWWRHWTIWSLDAERHLRLMTSSSLTTSKFRINFARWTLAHPIKGSGKMTPRDHTRFCMRHRKITVNEHDVVLNSTVGKRQKYRLVDAGRASGSAIGWRIATDSGGGACRTQLYLVAGHLIFLPHLWCPGEIYIYNWPKEKNRSAIEHNP